MTARDAVRRRRPGIARALALALLWGMGVAAFELSGLPWDQFDALALLRFGLDIMVCWSVVGLVLVGYAAWATGRWPAPVVLAAYLFVVAPVSALFYAGVIRSGLARYVDAFEVTSSYGYLLWSASFYGALFLVGWIAAERGEATRRLLADAQIARRRSEAELDRARLFALRGQVDPGLVYDVMTLVQQRYRDDPPAGDRLLELLVAFLRCAMPAVRSGSSSLSAEVALVRVWSALMRERDPRHPAWQLDVPAALPEIAFPPLLLLPVLEQVGRRVGPAPPVLRIRTDDAGARLVADAGSAASALEPALLFRLRVGLQTVHGEHWSLVLHEPSAATGGGWTLTLPSRTRRAGAEARHAFPLPHEHPGGSPWTTSSVIATT